MPSMDDSASAPQVATHEQDNIGEQSQQRRRPQSLPRLDVEAAGTIEENISPILSDSPVRWTNFTFNHPARPVRSFSNRSSIDSMDSPREPPSPNFINPAEWYGRHGQNADGETHSSQSSPTSPLEEDEDVNLYDKNNPHKFLPGIDNITCYICHVTYKTGFKGQKRYEQPMTLPCGHTFGSRCLSTWINDNLEDDVGCPICRGQTYKKQDNPRYLDPEIENAIFPKPGDLKVGLEDLTWSKRDVLTHDCNFPEGNPLKCQVTMACVRQCLLLYLQNAIQCSIREDRDTDEYQDMLDILNVTIKARATHVQAQLVKDLEDLMKSVIIAAPSLWELVDERIRIAHNLVLHTLGSEAQPSPFAFHNMCRASQTVPRLLACLEKYREGTYFGDRYEVDLDALYKADMESTKTGDDSRAFQVSRTYTKQDMLFVLESWGVKDAETWTFDANGEASVPIFVVSDNQHQDYDGHIISAKVVKAASLEEAIEVAKDQKAVSLEERMGMLEV